MICQWRNTTRRGIQTEFLDLVLKKYNGRSECRSPQSLVVIKEEEKKKMCLSRCPHGATS